MSLFKSKRAAHQEITDPENRRATALLNQRAIRQVTLWEEENAFLDSLTKYVTDVREHRSVSAQVKDPCEGLGDTFLELSASDGGRKLDALVETAKASAPPPTGISITPASPAQPQKTTEAGL